jgi:hypothetical protein
MTAEYPESLTPISRRRAIALLGLLAASAAVPVGSWRGLVQPTRHADIAARLAALISAHNSGRAIGLAYIAKVPEEAGRELVLHHLTRTLQLAANPSPAENELRSRLTSAVSQDFATGQTVTLDGWVLSRTEARLGALIAMM